MPAYHFSTDYGVLHIVMEHAGIPHWAIFAVAIVATIIVGWLIWIKTRAGTEDNKKYKVTEGRNGS